MERLTNRIKQIGKDDLIVYTKGKYEDTVPGEMSHDDIRAVLKKLAYYEDAEEQGLFVKIQCHCKDCKHWWNGSVRCTEHVKLCAIGGYMIGENGYCLYAEKESEER